MNYNKDIMDWAQFPEHDMIWCDPPWEERMVKYFQTVMKRDSGREARNTIDGILKQLARLSSKNKLIVIEYSIKGHERVIRHMEAEGHTFKRCFERTYDNRPFCLMTFNVDIDLFETKNEADLVTETLKTLPNHIKTVFDPFAGIGFTARCVRKAGLKYIGSEINPARYAKLIKVNK